MLRLYFISNLDWISNNITTVETVTEKIRALIHSLKFLLPEVVLFFTNPLNLHGMLFQCLGWSFLFTTWVSWTNWRNRYVGSLKLHLILLKTLTLKKLYGPFLWMRFNCLKARATSRRQFTFYLLLNTWLIIKIWSVFPIALGGPFY